MTRQEDNPAVQPDETAGAIGPVTPPERIASVDVLRGFALFGILLLNITAFGLPNAAFSDPTVAGGPSGVNFAWWFASQVHLIWSGDILYGYGVAGLFLFPFRRQSAKFLLAAGLIVLALGVPKSVLEGRRLDSLRVRAGQADAAAAGGRGLTEEQIGAQSEWRDTLKGMKPTAAQVREEVEAHRGSFLVVLPIWIAQLLWSPLWLRRFRFGPMEWVWRSLVYWRPQAMRLAAALPPLPLPAAAAPRVPSSGR